MNPKDIKAHLSRPSTWFTIAVAMAIGGAIDVTMTPKQGTEQECRNLRESAQWLGKNDALRNFNKHMALYRQKGCLAVENPGAWE